METNKTSLLGMKKQKQERPCYLYIVGTLHYNASFVAYLLQNGLVHGV